MNMDLNIAQPPFCSSAPALPLTYWRRSIDQLTENNSKVNASPFDPAQISKCSWQLQFFRHLSHYRRLAAAGRNLT